jgi:hypothetical protein
VEEKALDGAEKEKHRQDQQRGEDRRHIETETHRHTDRRHHPDRGRRGQPVDLVALAEDCARSQKADAGDDLRGDARRVGRTSEGLEPETRKQARADSDQSEGLDSGRVAMELAFETDRDCEDGGDEQTQCEIDVA